jgi:energy-converting hydrogenase Eha subunit C
MGFNSAFKGLIRYFDHTTIGVSLNENPVGAMLVFSIMKKMIGILATLNYFTVSVSNSKKFYDITFK